MKNNQWESSVKTVEEAWVFNSEKWIAPLWGPGDLVSIIEVSESIILLWHILNGGTCQTCGYPGTRTRGFQAKPEPVTGFARPGCTRRVPGFRSSGVHLHSTHSSIHPSEGVCCDIAYRRCYIIPGTRYILCHTMACHHSQRSWVSPGRMPVLFLDGVGYKDSFWM